LDVVQLHGSETPETCQILKQESRVIKAFGVNEDFNFKQVRAYENHVDHFLFDTKTSLHGGSGRQFDWSILSKYKGSVPFLLSGGINPKSVEYLKNLNHPKLVGIDLNSGFENSPADKNIAELKQFIKQLRQ
jgi:phosphoribosylanthranilate isomerase